MLLLYFRNDDQAARDAALQIIEEGKSYDLGKGWSVRRDRTHHDPTSHHNHVQLKGNDVSVINGDGTQSHNTTRDKVPNRVVDWLVDKKFIKEGVDWPVESSGIDPVIADKVRRIETYGIRFELDFMQQFNYWSSRFFGGR
jgi:hypothetical protein